MHNPKKILCQIFFFSLSSDFKILSMLYIFFRRQEPQLFIYLNKIVIKLFWIYLIFSKIIKNNQFLLLSIYFFYYYSFFMKFNRYFRIEYLLIIFIFIFYQLDLYFFYVLGYFTAESIYQLFQIILLKYRFFLNRLYNKFIQSKEPIPFPVFL